jgi:glycosyltransferase 2 family protein
MLAAGVVLGALMLFAAVRQVDWGAVGAAVVSIAPVWLALSFVFAVAAQSCFAARWHVLASDLNLTFADAFDFLAIGALAGLVLPPRLSDVARAVAASRFRATSATGLFGTIVVERLLDVLMLVAFGAAVSLLMPVPLALRGALAALLAIVFAAIVVLWFGNRGPVGAIARWAGRLRGPASRLHVWTDMFLAGVGVIREPVRVPKAFAATLAGWICAATAVSFLFIALAAPAPWFAAMFVIVVVNLAGILPAPPAGVGVYHYAAMFAVSPWIQDNSAAFAFALISHATSITVALTTGSFSLARKGLSIRGLRRMAQQQVSE